MDRRELLAIALVVVFLMLNASHVFGQSSPRLQIIMIGGQGTYVAPAGQTTQLKLEIFNAAPGAIALIQGVAYLDPSLSGTWVLVHAESLGGFQVGFMQSAIWSFNLDMPAKIRAANQTNGLPWVVLMIQITYSTIVGSVQSQQQLFPLGVPGASVAQPYGLILVAGVACVIVLVAILIAFRAYRKARK